MIIRSNKYHKIVKKPYPAQGCDVMCVAEDFLSFCKEGKFVCQLRGPGGTIHKDVEVTVTKRCINEIDQWEFDAQASFEFACIPIQIPLEAFEVVQIGSELLSSSDPQTDSFFVMLEE